MKKQLLLVILVSLVSLALFWAPFYFHVESFWGINFASSGMDSIVSNFDGLNFLVVERTWYEPELIEKFNQSFLTNRDAIYFTAHFPGYAILISLFDIFFSGPNALLISVVVSNILLAAGLYWFFYYVISQKHATLLSIAALFFPARMLSVRSVGSTEPMFIFFILTSLVLHSKKKYWLAGILGAFAILTRGPGLLLFAAYALYYLILYKSNILGWLRSITPYLLIPAALVGLWGYYGTKFGSFFAYFQSGDNLHLFFPPFQVFSNTQAWAVGTGLEDVVYLYLFFGVGIVLLWQNLPRHKKVVGWLAGIYFASVLFVAHRDIARYALPIAPFVIAGYKSTMIKPWMKWVMLVMLVPIYLVSWNFVLQNVQGVNDWSAFL